MGVATFQKLNQEEGHWLKENRRRKSSGKRDITSRVKRGRSDGQSARDFDFRQWLGQRNLII